MNDFSLRQSSGNYATIVDVIVCEDDGGAFYANVVTILTDHEPTAAEAEAEAVTVMVAQVADEGDWGRVFGASVRPLGTTGFVAEQAS